MWRPQSRYNRLSHIECRIKFPQNQRCRAKLRYTPRKIKVSHLSPEPPVALSSHSKRRGPRRGVAAGWWRVLRHFWVPKTDCATGGCRSYSHTNHATLRNYTLWEFRPRKIRFSPQFPANTLPAPPPHPPVKKQIQEKDKEKGSGCGS